MAMNGTMTQMTQMIRGSFVLDRDCLVSTLRSGRRAGFRKGSCGESWSGIRSGARNGTAPPAVMGGTSCLRRPFPGFIPTALPRVPIAKSRELTTGKSQSQTHVTRFFFTKINDCRGCSIRTTLTMRRNPMAVGNFTKRWQLMFVRALISGYGRFYLAALLPERSTG